MTTTTEPVIFVEGLDMASLFRGLERYKNGNRENFMSYEPSGDNNMLGLTTTTFIVLLLFNILLWVWALKVLLQYKNEIPTWALVIGILGLIGFVIPGGPLLTLIVVYASKGRK
jgi:hypothetical protein